MSFFSKKDFDNKAGLSSGDAAAAVPSAAADTASDQPIPMPAPAPAATETASSAEELAAGLSPEFYGSYGGSVVSDSPAASGTASASDAGSPGSGIDFSVLDFDIPESVASAASAMDSVSSGGDVSPLPMPSAADTQEDDDLVLPDLSAVSSASSYETKKSMGYETTVKLQNARSAYGNQKPVNEPIKSSAELAPKPKVKDYTVVASGTAHVKGDLPPLKDGQMYVALTSKDLRLLRSRRFRGLGVLATLCLTVIAAFCIWRYAGSFTDPIIGVWKGDVDAASVPITQIQELGSQTLQSTWEFSSSGSLYLNLVVNDTPVNLNGTYEQKKDEGGEPYLSMTLTNPMDPTSDYTMEMYYTVTGKILEFNDMDGMGMTIDLKKE
ncbi:MAG: hypothetical protein II828_06165 [Clostridia bacterium]|nr:hypothetical protein [Clostridia bacterium]